MTVVKKDTGKNGETIYRLDRNGKMFIAHREAIVLTAYQDGPHMSIGMGDNDPSLEPGHHITIKEAFERFAKAIDRRETLLSKRITREPTQEQFNALFSCFYQSGWRNVPHLLDMHNNGAAAELVGAAFSAPEHCTDKSGRFLRGLQKRRILEGQLYSLGEYEDDLETVDYYEGDPRDPMTKVKSYTIKPEDIPE